MGNRPAMIYDGVGSCGDCKHASDYVAYSCGGRNACTVKCSKHGCRSYALGGRCDDYETAKEVVK